MNNSITPDDHSQIFLSNLILQITAKSRERQERKSFIKQNQVRLIPQRLILIFHIIIQGKTDFQTNNGVKKGRFLFKALQNVSH